jgi:hypothetical protein
MPGQSLLDRSGPIELRWFEPGYKAKYRDVATPSLDLKSAAD